MPHTHHHDHCSHEHPHTEKSHIGTAFFLNLSFTIVELIGGFLTNSTAIISDAVHDFGDSISLGTAWYFQKLSKRASTQQYSYGHRRFSLLGAIINAAVLIAGTVYVLSSAVPRLFSPQETDSKGMFLLAVAGIVINGVAALRTHRGSSMNERMVSLHLLEDVLGWVAVLAGSAVMHFTGLTVIDPILSTGISCFVLYNVFRNIRKVFPILLQRTPDGIDHEQLVRKLKQLDSIADIHDLHVWALDEKYHVLTVHVVLRVPLSMESLYALKMQIRSILKDDIHHTTIEFELHDEECAFADCVSSSSLFK